MLCGVALAWAALCFPLYFHARYCYPLFAWVLPLAIAGSMSLGRRPRAVLYALLIAASALRFGGWLVPLPLATIGPELVQDESRSWHEGHGQDLRENLTPWLHPLYTIRPLAGPDAIGEVLDDVASACGSERCELHLRRVPEDYVPHGVFSESSVLEYHVQFVRRSERIKIVRELPMGRPCAVLLLGPRAPSVEEAKRALGGRTLALVASYQWPRDQGGVLVVHSPP